MYYINSTHTSSLSTILIELDLYITLIILAHCYPHSLFKIKQYSDRALHSPAAAAAAAPATSVNTIAQLPACPQFGRLYLTAPLTHPPPPPIVWQTISHRTPHPPPSAPHSLADYIGLPSKP